MNIQKSIKNCKIIRLYSQIGKRWSVLILNLFTLKEEYTFNEILRCLHDEINNTLLSSRLKNFVELDILKKNGNKYVITKFGKQLNAQIKDNIKELTSKNPDIMKNCLLKKYDLGLSCHKN